MFPIMQLVNANIVFFIRNNKKYFSTTIIQNNSRKFLFKNKLNKFQLNLLKNKNFPTGTQKRIQYLKVLLMLLKREFKKVYKLKVKEVKLKKISMKKWNKQIIAVFYKRLFKKTLNVSIKKMNCYVFNRTLVLYKQKQLKKKRLKLIFSYEKTQHVLNKKIEKFLLKRIKVRNFLYGINSYNSLVKAINRARENHKPSYFVSLNLWRSQSHNYFRYYVYRRKFFRFKNLKGITILPWVNQNMRTYFHKKYIYSLATSLYVGKRKFVTKNKKLSQLFANSKNKYFRSTMVNVSLFKRQVMFKAKIYKYFYKKFRKSQIMPIVLFYRGNKLCLINLSRQGNAWNIKLKQKKLLRWLFTGQKRTLGKIKRMKKGIKLITLKKNKALRKYKKIQSAFQLYLTKKRNLKSVKFNKYLVGLIQHKQLLNNTKAHQRFLFLNKKFIIFFKKLFLLKKNYYMYQKVLSLKKKMVKKKLLKLGRYNNNRVPFNLARIRRSLVMSYRKRDFFKKTYLDFFMKLYQDKKAFANGKKKNYNKVLLRFFNRTCKPKATFYNYMKYYKYYRVKMLYYNFMQPHFKVKKQGRFFSNQYNKKAIRNKHKYASTRQAYFNFKLHYRLLLPKIFRSPNSKRYHQIKSRQMKYLKYRLYRNYFKRCYKRKVVNNSVFQLRRRIRKILPWRVKKFKYSYYQYQRFSYYWLRYFFHRFKKMYMNEETASYAYAPVKRYLLTWLFKLSRYKYLSLHAANPARGFLIYKSTQLYSKYKKKAYPVLKLKRFKPIRYFLNRQKIDWALRRDIFKKRYMYRSLYWRYYKDFFERKKISLLNRQYYFRRNYLPYVYTQKKHKMFYNWGDRHLFKRYPLYRYKYNLFFKFPRFADYRRLFKNQLREQHVFRYLYRLKLSQLIKHYRKSIYKTKRIFELMFLKHFELRLDTVIYRLNFAWTLKHARQLVLRGLFLVNNKIIDSHRYHISLGDVIMPIKRLRMQPLSKKYINTIDNGLWLSWNRLFFRSIQVDQYPEHFLLNERIPAGMLIGNVNPNKVRYNKPFSLQFLTLSLLKYN